MAELDVFFYIITKQTMAKKQPQTREEILNYAKKKFGKQDSKKGSRFSLD